MKERIIEILREHPYGLRKRDIASIIGVWTPNLVKPMTELERAGIVKSNYYRDAANMEFYDIWVLTENE